MEKSPRKFVSGSQKSDARRKTPIAAEFEDCIQVFQQLCSSLEAGSTAWGGSGNELAGLFGRLRAWGNESGASTRSLDHRLRKASRLQNQVLEFLGDLRVELENALQVVQSTTVFSPPARASGDVEYFAIIPRVGEPPTPGIVPDDAKLGIDVLAQNAADTFDCLCDLVPLLQDPIPEDTFERNASPSEAQKDIEQAERMFPNAAKTLSTRLGQANWKRRQYQQKLTSAMDRDRLRQPHERHEAPVKVHTIRPPGPSKNTGSPPAKSHNPMWSVHFDPTGYRKSQAALSDTSNTGMLSNSESVFSAARTDYFDHRSIVTSIAELDDPQHSVKHTRLAVPKPPIPLKYGQGFLCPYCLHEILIGDDILSEKDWSDHVFVDLEPYICTWDNCVRADKTFSSKDTWFQHELDNHRLRKIWLCQSCRTEFDQREELEAHFLKTHDDTLGEEQLTLMASMCERFSQESLISPSCKLCGTTCPNTEDLKDHTASHMEQLALTSIYSDDGLDDDNLDNQESNSRESVPTIELKKERLEEFLLEQQQMRFASASKPSPTTNNISTDSDPGFMGDSEDEAPTKVEIAALVPPQAGRVQRPGIVRNGASFLTKVEDFLDHHVDLETIASTMASPSEEERSKLPAIENNRNIFSPTKVSHTIRIMTPPPNEAFVGRQYDLAKLYKELSISGHTCILSGSGGRGKSATAIEYTYNFEQTYQYIFWVQAETPIGCADSYGRIASALGLDQGDIAPDLDRLIMLTRAFLETTGKRWLLVFDNVEELADIHQYFPKNHLKSRGSILITTRNMKGWPLTAPPQYARIELGVLSLDDSRLLLLSNPNTNITELRKHPEYNLAGEIANFAERLPLALSHIAGYIQVSGCSLEDFVELWKERQKHTTFHLPSTDVLTPTDKALEIVWNIGLREVTIDARELLNILAFLDSDTIQKDLLVGEHSELSLEILHSSEAFRYKRMTNELSRRRLIGIRARGGEEILSIHRSLQAKILQDLDKDPRQRERVYQQAFLLVRQRFPLPSPIQVPEPEKWPACIKYLRHVFSLQKAYAGTSIKIAPSIELAKLLSDGGIGLWERGMTAEGLDLLYSAESVLKQLDCDEAMLKANIHVIIALLLQDQGSAYFSESKERISKALEIREQFRRNTPKEKYTKNDDILLHNAKSDYGCVLLQYNRYQEAETIFAQCLMKYREWGKDEEIPYEHAKYNHHMAFCQMVKGNFAEAVKLAERGVHFVMLATGKGASCNTWKFDMACIVLQSGDLNRSLRVHKEVLNARLEHHGKSSFLTLQSYYAVGAIYAYLEDQIAAESNLREALVFDSSSREAHPEAAIARTRYHLAQVLRIQQKDLEESNELEVAAMDVLGRLLKLNPLEGVYSGDTLALFDHLQPVFDGRFTGRSLLQYLK